MSNLIKCSKHPGAPYPNCNECYLVHQINKKKNEIIALREGLEAVIKHSPDKSVREYVKDFLKRIDAG